MAVSTVRASIVDIYSDKDAAASSLIDPSGHANVNVSGGGKKAILFFWAEWHAPSNSGGPFDAVVKALAEQNDGSVQFFRVLAEETPEVARKYNVNTVPTFLFIDDGGTVIDRIDGGEDVASVTQSYSKLVSTASSSSSFSPSRTRSQSTPEQQRVETNDEETQPQGLNERLRSLIESSPIMLFLKGTPNAPKCGFSRQAAELLTSPNLTFGYFDILGDDEVRQGLKTYSDWPTYPQLYVRGELVGGIDIMKELEGEEGGIVEQLELDEFVVKNFMATSIAAEDEQQLAVKKDAASLDEKLKSLINQHRIMLFMKGIPSAPRCGFSRQIVEILDSFDASYDAFNILEDEDVRQRLKSYSDWPTYPQLYVEGDLVGGLDIVKEMMEAGELEDVLTGASQG